MVATAPHQMVVREVHGVLDVPTAVWRGILPDGSAVKHMLRGARCGHLPEKWFSHIWPRDRRDLFNDLASLSRVIIGRLNGAAIPWPQHVPLDQASVVARWAAQAIRDHGVCLVNTQVSRALRVSLAAQEAGLDLTGATFMIAGEPPTPAKVRGIERCGARTFPTYGMAECSRVAMGCGQPSSCNDLHLLKDAFAVIQHPRQAPGAQTTVPAYNVTALLHSAPKLMLNVEVDDYGVMERRSCGCPLEELGYDVHLRDMRSFRKLTGEGVTLVGSEVVRILEEVLPARFGGSPLDYQLLEEEDRDGFTRLSLLVHPRIDIASEAMLIETVLNSLQEAGPGPDGAQYVWREANSLRVKRVPPIWTDRGKFMPLHIQKRATNERRTRT
jgi:hypothetical protein